MSGELLSLAIGWVTGGAEAEVKYNIYLCKDPKENDKVIRAFTIHPHCMHFKI